MVNKVHLIGNLGSDIEIKKFDDGGIIGNVSLATSSTYKNKSSGEKVKTTEWFRLVFRNRQAESVEKYCKKGDRLYVEGAFKTRTYEDKDGEKKFIMEVQVRDMVFLNNKENGAAATTTTPPTEDEPDDLPF